MRKNETYKAVMPSSRNDFVDCVNNEEPVIVLRHKLLTEMREELNVNIKNRKDKKTINTVMLPLTVFNLTNPIGWTTGAYMLVSNVTKKNELKKYRMYEGEDVHGNVILALHHKLKVDPEYDTVVYDGNWIKSVNLKEHKKRLGK